MATRYPRALTAVASGSALPYGYTITLWSSGAVVMHRHGPPSVGDVYLFLIGAIAGFAATILAGRPWSSQLRPSPAALLVTGATHVAAVGAAVGAAALIALIHAWVAWPVASFAATAIYLAIASLELLLAQTRSDAD